jgi:hypothetical protein
MRRLLFSIAVGIVAIGSFLLTLWFTGEPAVMDARAAGEQLAVRHVGSAAELRQITAEIGLSLSRDMAGSIDGVTRINEREVAMSGWLADPQGDATPQQLIVYVSGRLAGKGETKGERPDVTYARGLAFGTEKNVRFALNFACPNGDQPVVVGIGSRSRYIPLASPRCP